MASIYALPPAFPDAFGGFSKVEFKLATADTDVVAEPPRKTARLSTGSGSRTPRTSGGGPIRLSIAGNQQAPGQTQPNSKKVVFDAIKLVYSKEDIKRLILQSVYNACRSVVCAANKGDDLYGELKLANERCISDLVKRLEAPSSDYLEWVRSFVAECVWFEQRVNLMTSMLSYLDQLWIRKDPELQSVHALAYNSFNDKVLSSENIVGRIQGAIKAWVTSERKLRMSAGNPLEIDDAGPARRPPHKERPTMKALVEHLTNHGRYQEVFEGAYLEFTREFYQNESKAAAAADSVGKHFANDIQSRVEEERNRCEDILPIGSWALVQSVTEAAFVETRERWLGDIVMKTLLKPATTKTETAPQLRDMYQLFSRVDAVENLCAAFKAYLTAEVIEIVKDKHPEVLAKKLKEAQEKGGEVAKARSEAKAEAALLDDEMVPKLLLLKSIADKALVSDFGDSPVSYGAAGPSNPPVKANPRFKKALDDAFTQGFKLRSIKPAEQLAKNIDHALKKGHQGQDAAAFLRELEEALELHRYSTDKDVFRAFYHRALAKRLLLDRSASTDDEKAILVKLKNDYDQEFGSAEGMFKDLELSKSLTSEYRRNNAGTALHATVLTQAAWPFASRALEENKKKTEEDSDSMDVDSDRKKSKSGNADPLLPVQMQSELDAFVKFYTNKHKGRTLNWDHRNGMVTLSAWLAGTKHEVSVSIYQAVVLLLFNDRDSYTYDEIQDHTQMGDVDLRRTLQSLALGKKRILKKDSAGKEVNDGDTFTFNAGFKEKVIKFSIPSIQPKETAAETKRTSDKVEGDRTAYLDACIVRIMKSKKKMRHEALMNAVVEGVKAHFAPNVNSIKKRIDAMMVQEYIERSSKDASMLLYLA